MDFVTDAKRDWNIVLARDGVNPYEGVEDSHWHLPVFPNYPRYVKNDVLLKGGKKCRITTRTDKDQLYIYSHQFCRGRSAGYMSA